jgi:hypothetical protein
MTVFTAAASKLVQETNMRWVHEWKHPAGRGWGELDHSQSVKVPNRKKLSPSCLYSNKFDVRRVGVGYRLLAMRNTPREEAHANQMPHSR